MSDIQTTTQITAAKVRRDIRSVQRVLSAERPIEQEDRDCMWKILQECLAEVEALELEAMPEVEGVLV